MVNPPSFYTAPIKHLSNRLEKLVRGRLWLKVLIGLGLGILLGLLLGPDVGLVPGPMVDTITAWLALPGQLFLALIQMIVVPLVIASIVRGLAANNDPQAMKKIGLIALLFIAFTTVFATATGIGLGQLIQPGRLIQLSDLPDVAATSSTVAPAEFPALADVPNKVLSLLPRNPMASMVSGEMLQVILFAALLGFALLAIPAKQAQPLFDLLVALQEVSMRIVSWAMRLAPLAVFGLMTKLVANLGLEVLAGMLLYVATVLIGLLVVVCLYLVIIKLTSNVSVFTSLSRLKELLLLAFSTSSSAAVMPLSLQVVENDLKVRPGIARFLIPLGATINMTGTALYQGVAAVFLAQVFHIDLTLTSYAFIVTMAIAASVGSPATPGAGIVILSLVLEGVGVPAAGIALLLGVDRILDMCRTAVNVLGDVAACLLVERLMGGENAELTPTNANRFRNPAVSVGDNP